MARMVNVLSIRAVASSADEEEEKEEEEEAEKSMASRRETRLYRMQRSMANANDRPINENKDKKRSLSKIFLPSFLPPLPPSLPPFLPSFPTSLPPFFPTWKGSDSHIHCGRSTGLEELQGHVIVEGRVHALGGEREGGREGGSEERQVILFNA